MSDDYLWDPAEGLPDPLVAQLEAALRPLRTPPPPLAPVLVRARHRRARTRWMRLSLAGAGVLAAAGLAIIVTRPTPWQAVAERGDVRIDKVTIVAGETKTQMVVETGRDGRASLTVGRYGLVTVGAGTRLRVDQLKDDRRRVSLDFGSLHARIAAPPRVFSIRTASTNVTDLGCIFALSADSAGTGTLTVAEGRVELERQGVRVVVPAGYSAAFRRGAAPGAPVALSSSPAFREIAQEIQRDGVSPARLASVLRLADSTSAITLWYLLPSLPDSARAEVIDRLAQLVPPPASVTHAQLVAGERTALAAWERALEHYWTPQPTSWWRRALMRRGIWAKPAVRLPLP